MNKKLRFYISFIMSVAVLTFFLYTQLSRAGYLNPRVTTSNGISSPIKFKVYFFDVGQGDSILIRTADGKDILIDGGPDGTVLERLGEILPIWDRKIDWLILTHPHEDHIAGLFEVLPNYQFDQILEPSLLSEPTNLAYFNNRTDKEKGAQYGDQITLADDLKISFIYPLSLQVEAENLNDTSLVFKLSYKDIDFLFTGDATEEVEQKILDSDLDIEFLKVGHHGSRYSSSEDFLEATTPLVSIISVGAGNSFGHPTSDALNRLSAIGSRILRTDKNGTIEIDVGEDGSWQIICSKGCN